jgi:hypothetical protein
MKSMNFNLTIKESIDRGFLVDVTDVAEGIGIPFAVVMSKTLYNDEAILPSRRRRHLEDIIEMSLRSKTSRWSEMRGDDEEEFSFGSFLDRDDCTYPIYIRVIVERQPDGRLAAVLLKSEERFSSRYGPAASYHEN